MVSHQDSSALCTTQNTIVAWAQERLRYKNIPLSGAGGIFVLFLDKASEVVKAGLLPFPGVLQLVLHAIVNLLPALYVDGGSGLLPDADEVFNFFYTTGMTLL